MPSLAPLHPVIVRFAIAPAVAGVLLRWLWLSGRVAWAGPVLYGAGEHGGELVHSYAGGVGIRNGG